MSHSCHGPSNQPDWLFWAGLVLVVGSALAVGLTHWTALSFAGWPAWLVVFVTACTELLLDVWPGIVLGVLALMLLASLPSALLFRLMGPANSWQGLWRAVMGGLFLDLCSHGILMVAAQLYRKGVSTGQVMAFLVTSPWNSLSLTFILISLIGLGWTLLFMGLSAIVGLVTGWVFQQLEQRGHLSPNPHAAELQRQEASLSTVSFGQVAWQGLRKQDWSPAGFWRLFSDSLKEARMVMRWLWVGIVLTGLLRAFVPQELFLQAFGPGWVGLLVTLVTATVLEVCSEGSAPIAADILTRAAAPGNAFAFLMAGASTDYTEILVMRQTTGSWKKALLIPVITLPQILLLAWLIQFAASLPR